MAAPENLVKILIVEDEHSLRKDIADFLSYEGFEVFEAENGLTGIAQARKHLPDLIVCDVMMPEADGYTVLAELQKEPRTAAIPFVFVTARTDKADRRRGMDQGAYDYITKPFSVDELLRSVKTRLEIVGNVKQVVEDKNRNLRDNIILSLPHDLRTPLTTILGFSDILIAESENLERDEITDMVQHIHHAAVRLYHLAENHLIYAQIEIAVNDPEYNQFFSTIQTHRPQTLIEDRAIRKAQEHHREADLTLEVQDIETIHILDDYLKKVVDELVDNAFRFSEPGTPVKVALHRENERVLLSVTDAGHGITAEQIRNLNTFTQFDHRLFDQQRPGLGLTIARRIAEIHGGQLQITSIPTQGTTITVQLQFNPEG